MNMIEIEKHRRTDAMLNNQHNKVNINMPTDNRLLFLDIMKPTGFR